MKKVNQTICLIFSLFFCLFFSSTSLTNARRFSPEAVLIGEVVNFNGRKLIKVTTTGKFVDLAWWKTKSNTTMQGWDDCASLATPTGTNFTQGPTLIDVRDNKQYEIRKFADGKCWMVDNLMYGGDIDACAGKSTFVGNGSATPSNQFSAGTYGDRRDPRVGGSAPCTTGSTTCGYYYNWQAAMQHASAYYNTAYTGPTTNVQGLCPEGWRLPSSNTSGDFGVLHSLVGSPATGFWQPPGNWKGVYGGYCAGNGVFDRQGTYGYWWSTTLSTDSRSYLMYFINSSAVMTYTWYKNGGFSIRCLKN